MPDFSYENSINGLVAGLDEAGCGPWAGPVMAGAAILFPDKIPAGFLDNLNDSKKLTAKKRETLYEALCEMQGNGVFWAAGLATVEEIDQLNIRQAAMLAMARAMEKLTIKPSFALVDGIVCPKLDIPTRAIRKGDSLSYSIAAASIVAKVERDRLMHKLSIEFPQYGWDKNAGYGTAFHISALEKHGVTPHHRTSYAPIARFLAAS